MPRKLFLVLTLTALGVFAVVSANAQTSMQVYGAWHCGSDFCTWASGRRRTNVLTRPRGVKPTSYKMRA